MLNAAYKIASACIANRLKVMLPNIHNDQNGFMKGRYIGEIIRLLYDVLVQTEIEQNQQPGSFAYGGLCESI